jgi:hypothetical protein
MALFFECMPLCAQKVLDTADIVREAMFRQLDPSPQNVGPQGRCFVTIYLRMKKALGVLVRIAWVIAPTK